VVAGPGGLGDTAVIPPSARRANLAIDYVGYVPEADLPALTAGAAVFVYPSLYEVSDCPLAPSRWRRVFRRSLEWSSLPEVAGGRGAAGRPAQRCRARRGFAAHAALAFSTREFRRPAELFVRSIRWEVCAQKSWKSSKFVNTFITAGFVVHVANHFPELREFRSRVSPLP